MKITEFAHINSKDNSRVKLARAARDGKEKDLIFVEGIRLAAELIKSKVKIRYVFLSNALTESKLQQVSEMTIQAGAEVYSVAEKAFGSITDTDSSQGIVVLAERPSSADLQEIVGEKRLIVFLQKVNNPSNLGAVVRSAEAAGVTAVVTSRESADPYSPKALRASMGSAFRLPIRVDATLEKLASYAEENGISIVAADVNAKKRYYEYDWTQPSVIVFGSEAHGLSPEELSLADEIIKIPMANGVESLNLAVSAGVILFEAKRQRDLLKN